MPQNLQGLLNLKILAMDAFIVDPLHACFMFRLIAVTNPKVQTRTSSILESFGESWVAWTYSSDSCAVHGCLFN